jgi:hypothetical protein
MFSTSPTFMEPHMAEQPHADYAYYAQQQPVYARTQSAQKFETSRVFSPRLQEGESYIKELSSLQKGELKRPFELLEQSTARNQGSGSNYPHLQRISAQRAAELH